jgi:hypothetical protein
MYPYSSDVASYLQGFEIKTLYLSSLLCVLYAPSYFIILEIFG